MATLLQHLLGFRVISKREFSRVPGNWDVEGLGAAGAQLFGVTKFKSASLALPIGPPPSLVAGVLSFSGFLGCCYVLL